MEEQKELSQRSASVEAKRMKICAVCNIICALASVASLIVLLVIARSFRSEGFVEHQVIVAANIALSLPDGWSAERSHGTPNAIHSTGSAELKIVAAGNLDDLPLSNPPRLQREDLPVVVENLPYGGEMHSHVFETETRYFKEGFIIRDGKHFLQFIGSCDKYQRTFGSDRTGSELLDILRSAKGVL